MPNANSPEHPDNYPLFEIQQFITGPVPAGEKCAWLIWNDLVPETLFPREQ